MDSKHLIAAILGIILGVAGALTGFNWKSEVCQSIPNVAAPNAVVK